MSNGQIDLNLGALAPVADEVLLTDLQVDGEIPPELSGILARNGPNPFDGRFSGEGMLSWWSGSAMLHGIAFDDGQALWYRNRWVRSGPWDRHHDPDTTVEPVRDQNTNVNVICHSGRVLALGEGSLPFAVTPELATLEPVTYDDALPGGMTAHPKIDPRTGELFYFRAHWQAPFLHYGVLDRHGRALAAQAVDLEAPVMMHDFAVTERYAIFLDLNVGYDFSMLEHGAAMPLRWRDDRASRLGVMARYGGSVRWFEIEPCFIQHVVNAWEQEAGELVLEAVRYPEFLRFDVAKGGFAPNPLGVLWRYELDLQRGTVAEAQLDDRCIELPRIDDRRSGGRNRFLYAVEQPTDTEMRGLLRYDHDRGGVERHPVPPGDQNSEPIFVPRTPSSAEDDGWILACVYRQASHTSDVVILDAARLADPPQATVHLPRPIPAGFHGAWLPS